MARLLLLMGCASLLFDGGAGRLCGRMEACGVIESEYTPATTSTASPTTTTLTTTTEELGSGEFGSGEGSGEDPFRFADPTQPSAPFVYDEVFLPIDSVLPAADAVPSGERFHALCDCPDNATCPSDGSLSLDQFHRLSLCGSLEEELPVACQGSGERAAGRVFGELGPGADPVRTRTMSAYTRARLFCRCPKALRRIPGIEPWPSSKGFFYAFKFACG